VKSRLGRKFSEKPFRVLGGDVVMSDSEAIMFIAALFVVLSLAIFILLMWKLGVRRADEEIHVTAEEIHLTAEP
jgi:hypothetical protein